MTGIRVVSLQDAQSIANNPPENLVVLDVRADHEFADGHLENAIMIDALQDDFADKLSALDTAVPYLLYCRSGARSGKAAGIMSELGFADVADIDGGFLAWSEAGLPFSVE